MSEKKNVFSGSISEVFLPLTRHYVKNITIEYVRIIIYESPVLVSYHWSSLYVQNLHKIHTKIRWSKLPYGIVDIRGIYIVLW